MGVQRGMESIGFGVAPVFLRDVARWPGSSLVSRAMRERARYARSAWRSATLGMALRGARVDVAVVSMAPELCARLATDTPIIYACDAPCGFGGPTLGGVHQPISFSRFRRWINAIAVRRAAAVIVGTEGARRYAIEHFSADPARVHVSGLGANVVCGDAAWKDRAAPSSEGVHLVQVASQPERKRVDASVRAAEILRQRGVAATLTLIGPPTPLARRSDAVVCLGRLRLSCEADAKLHRDAMLMAHAMLAPSRAEAFGIAAVEAAHFGLPVIATRVGGLAEIVRDGETGLLIPHDAGPAEIADAVERLMRDPARWRAMSAAARRLAVEEFTWRRWAERVAPVLERVIAEARPAQGALPVLTPSSL